MKNYFIFIFQIVLVVLFGEGCSLEQGTKENELRKPDSQSTFNCKHLTDPISQVEFVEKPEITASYPGGSTKLHLDIAAKIGEIDSHQLPGSMRVGFIVDEKGEVTSPRIMARDLISGEFEERVIFSMKRLDEWTPAKCGGESVKSYFEMLIYF